MDQIIIGGKASYDDFGASLSRAAKQPPKKKVVKETVPFSNITYDFTAINGEIYWEERELEYELEMTASTPEELEEMKTALQNWLLNVIEQELHDPFIPFHHFIATYDDMDFEDDEGMEKTTATVLFTAYPYMIANTPTVHERVISVGGSEDITIVNESSHRVVPTIRTDEPIILKFDNTSYSISAGETTDSKLMLPVGFKTLTVQNQGTAEATVSISYRSEVF